ncbi:MAG TPA: FAD-dependent oxidoreductase [Polyangiaceae bacterium]|jgi:NADPH-dependent 2,4-dienoyl-CoA reductase/sulfur reductase-like enzyme/nitrite reductase/ring-hydroxylating ferredoxin subunit
MSGSQELTGPDLSAGVSSSELGEGQMLVGHSGGEAVLLARSAQKVFAVGAHCTHYGGPLADGILVGETVRCPWHHACFSLESGAAERAPGRDPIACFNVEERGGKLYVLGKREPKAAPANPREPSSIVIVGAGPAGNSAAEKLRRAGYSGKLTLIGAEDSQPVDRPNLSKDYLAGNAPEEWIPLRPAEFYAEQKIELRQGVRAERVDTKAKLVELAGGEKLAYGALLLTTGATPIAPSIPGAELPHVFTLRTLADSGRIIEKSAGAKRAVVIGAGFIGLEVAASLRTRKIEVTVVAPDAVPLGRVLGESLGRAVQKLHESRGVAFRLGTRPSAISARSVKLEDGTELEADLVVFGIGVRPALELAEASGIAVDRGISVDQFLRTNAPDVFAAGDVARFPSAQSGDKIRVEHWVVATRQGETAALNMLGHEQPFDAVPFFWSAHYDTTISYLGHAESWDRIDVAGSIDDLDCALAFRKGERTLAFATIGRDRVSLEAEHAMEHRDEATLHRLVPTR